MTSKKRVLNQSFLTLKNKFSNLFGGKKTKINTNTKIIHNNKKQFTKLNCSPENDTNDFTCYSNEDLFKLRELWNYRHPDAKITSNSPKEIWAKFKEEYSNVCDRESCWINKIAKSNKDKKELIDSFAPEAPEEWKKNPNEWLSSVDILQVMKQYEKKYKCFEFMGPSPIDFDTHKLYGECVWEELCHFSLAEQIKKGKFKIGIIFNTDPHFKGGKHWISLFINVKKQLIFFFDSAGDPVPEQIQTFVNKVIEQGHQLPKKINFKFDQNYPVEHQYGNTECGIYSLFFIVQMLEDKITSNYLKTHILKDDYIEKFRNVYFNKDL
uniref:Ubiquitin-like protease family profile domain-containing protein n=1 Tax=viral metagenome TaxID=1070528 RepID=A0A6C0IRR7_9ZZZZ